MPQDFYVRPLFRCETEQPTFRVLTRQDLQPITGEYVIGCIDSRYRTIYEAINRISNTLLEEAGAKLQIVTAFDVRADDEYWLHAGYSNGDALTPTTIAHMSDMNTPSQPSSFLVEAFSHKLQTVSFATIGQVVDLTHLSSYSET